MPMTHIERKFSLILSLIMFKVTLCYVLIFDNLVLEGYGIHWKDLTITELCWSLMPAVISTVYGLFLMYMYKTASHIDWDDRYACSPYIGSKFNSI